MGSLYPDLCIFSFDSSLICRIKIKGIQVVLHLDWPMQMYTNL